MRATEIQRENSEEKAKKMLSALLGTHAKRMNARIVSILLRCVPMCSKKNLDVWNTRAPLCSSLLTDVFQVFQKIIVIYI